MSRIVAWIGLVMGAFSLILVGNATPARAEAGTTHFNQSFTVDGFLYGFSCPSGGSVEDMIGHGTIHVEETTTYDANGNAHFEFLTNLQGFSGIGVNTGTKYQLTGIQQGSVRAAQSGSGAESVTFTTDMRIVGQGPNNGYHDHAIYHVTLNANGELTAEVDRFESDCS